jgi:hypothetical protein
VPITTTTTNKTNINYDINAAVASAIAHATLVSPELKDAVKALIMQEQSLALSSVLRRLNSDEDGSDWETIRQEPATLIAMLIQAYAQRLEEELLVRSEREGERRGDQKEEQ